MNIVDALNIFYREDVISDLLKSCFEDSAIFLRQFLKCANIVLPEETTFTVQNRVGLGKSIGTPDMVIVGQTKSENHVVIIENKLGAAEGEAQTQRYESEEAKVFIKKRLNLKDANFHFVYLTLDTTVTPSNTNFTPVRYDVFLLHDWILEDSSLNLIFKDFKDKLHQFYEPLKQPKQALASNIPLDSTQKTICWQSVLFDEFKHMDQYILDWGPVGGSGRSNFLFRIDKSFWKAEKFYTETGLASTYDIHIDTYINLLSSNTDFICEISVRFETNPYVRHKDISKDDGYEAFIRNKRLFAELLYQQVRPHQLGAKKRNHKLQVMTIPVNNTEFNLSIEDYKFKVNILEKAIDEALKELLNSK